MNSVLLRAPDITLNVRDVMVPSRHITRKKYSNDVVSDDMDVRSEESLDPSFRSHK